MTSKSSCTIGSLSGGPIGDFVATFKFNGTPDPKSPFSLQFDLLGYNKWYQFVVFFQDQDVPGVGPIYIDNAPVPSGEMLWSSSPGTAAVEVYFHPTVSPTSAPIIGFAETGQYEADLFAGKTAVLLVVSGGQATLKIVDASGNALFTSPSMAMTDPVYVVDTQLVGFGGGDAIAFNSCEASLSYAFMSPVQVAFGPTATIQMGTYQGQPLYWADQTGESSNLWTNLVSQAPDEVDLQLSTAEGNQTPNNPVPPPPEEAFVGSNPTFGELQGFPSVSVTWTNQSGIPQSVILWCVVYNGKNEVADVLNQTHSFAAGASETPTCAMFLPPGSYKAKLFVQDRQGNGLSVPVEVPFTI